jgi:SAM-dependent methyltransferase
MSYSDCTFKDKNPVKRWLQSHRLIDAIALVERTQSPPNCILDFGAGNGELCKHLAERFPHARIICYEPTPFLMEEAKENLAGNSRVEFFLDVKDVPLDTVDILFCLEVFEHLPKVQTEEALTQIKGLLRNKGKAIIGVPVEIGLPALYKGLFRMTRRFGKFDASIKNVLLSVLFSPPKDRPMAEIAAGLPWHHEHLGFDYRHLRTTLKSWFATDQIKASPFPLLGPLVNPEINFVVQKID